jgi:hypothetical protein
MRLARAQDLSNNFAAQVASPESRILGRYSDRRVTCIGVQFSSPILYRGYTLINIIK